MPIPSKCESVKPGFRDIPATHVCRDEIQEGPKLKWVASERLCFASKQSPNFEDFNMAKIQSRPQTKQTLTKRWGNTTENMKAIYRE